MLGGSMVAMLCVGSLGGATTAAADARRWVLDPAASEVSFDVGATGHDVHGTVAVGSGEILFDSTNGTASGEIVVGAATAQTGNGKRDATLRNDVFEVLRYPEIRFVARRFTGELPTSGSGDVTLEGSLVLLGKEHPLSLPAHVTVSGPRVSAETVFTVPFLDWGLHDPSVFFLRVSNLVAIKVKTMGTLTEIPAGEPSR
jgi:polyisoprenoid-binding protein YceI